MTMLNLKQQAVLRLLWSPVDGYPIWFSASEIGQEEFPNHYGKTMVAVRALTALENLGLVTRCQDIGQPTVWANTPLGNDAVVGKAIA